MSEPVVPTPLKPIPPKPEPPKPAPPVIHPEPPVLHPVPPVVHPGPIKPEPPKFVAGTFTFELDSFKITNTRSRHEDTDYVSFTLLVKPQNGNGTPQTLKKSMGDLNNGTFKVGLTFSNIVVQPTDTVVLNYLIVNSGHKSESQIYSTLDSTAGKLATAGATAAAGALVGSAIPGLGTAIGAIAGWLAGEITGVLDANCDGAVAAEQNTLTLPQLDAKTEHGTFTQTTYHPGTDSATGCGSNSQYYVTWHIQKVK